MQSSFRHPVHIANRALQHCGARRIDIEEGFQEDSKSAQEVSACYDNLREAELRENTWKFAIRHAVLRPIETTSMLVTPVLWSAATTYLQGEIVQDAEYRLWVSVIAQNLNNTPANSYAWEPYFGSLVASEWDEDLEYRTGELVYIKDGDGGYTVFMARIDGTGEATPAAATDYSATRTYYKDELVNVAGTTYRSKVDLNLNNAPASSATQWGTYAGTEASIEWRVISATLSRALTAYPIGAGPSADSTTRNVFRLPSGFLAKAHQNPKQGSHSSLGAPTNDVYSDWDYDNDYLIATTAGPINFRFVGNATDVRQMDPLFCEGLACRIAVEVCEELTQSATKIQTIASAYKAFMSRAKQRNALEIGTEEQPLDDYIACRR